MDNLINHYNGLKKITPNLLKTKNFPIIIIIIIIIIIATSGEENFKS